MADGAIAGALTFSTSIDNSDLEKGLQDAESKVNQLKEKLEANDAQKTGLECQMESVQSQIEETTSKMRDLKSEAESILSGADMMDSTALADVNTRLSEINAQLDECNTTLDGQHIALERIQEQYDGVVEQSATYRSQLESAETEARELANTVSSTYYQAGIKVRDAFSNMSASASQFGQRVANLAQSALVFSVLTQALNTLKQGIVEALMQNESFSATWTYLSATMQGFANGIANAIAPALITVVNAVTACIVTLARAIDTVFKTGLVAAIESARKTSEEAWRQTDESKAAAKQAEQNAKSRAKQEEQYAKQVEAQKKREEKAAKRLADAQEKAAKRQAEAEQKYPDALEDAAERQAEAEEKMQERLADAEESAAKRQAKAKEKAQERYQKAVESAAKRQAKAEESAAERTASAQEAYEKKVAAAEKREANAAAKAEKRRTKEAERLEKAQKKANATLLGFDELNKMNAESTEEASESVDDYASTVEDIEPPKTYAIDPADYYIDPSDYVVDPKDYAIDYEDYQIDPEDFFVDPEDYTFDPMDYWVDPEDYAVDALEFDWQEFADIDPTASLKSSWDALDIGKISEQMVELEAILAGVLLAVGAILAFSGINIPLGLALMAAGALLYASIIGENWEKLPAQVREAITNALVIGGIVLIVIGAVLAFSGVATPLGVGMMAAGLAIEYGALALNWNSLTPEMQQTLTTLLGVVSAAFVVLGVILLLAAPDPAHKAIGIGLIIAGSLGMAVSIALVWNSLEPETQAALTRMMVIIGGLAIVIGVVLLLAVPGMQALGIGLIIAGAALLGTAIALNWGSLGETVTPTLLELVKVIGYFSIVIGVVLLFTGPQNIPLGLGLIVAGIGLIEVSEVLLNWDTLDAPLNEKLGALLDIIGEVAVVIGVILLFVPGHQALGVGLIITGAALIGGSEVAMNWESLNGDLAGTLAVILKTVAEFAIIIGIVLLFVPMVRPIGIGLIIFGISMLGASEIAEDWESLSTDLDGAFQKILKIVSRCMLLIGVVLLVAGPTLVLKGLGLGLIVAGIALLDASEEATDWESLGTKLSETFTALLEIASRFMIVIGLVMLFALPDPIHKAIGLGLIIGGIALLKVTEAAVNWDDTKDKVGEKLREIVEIIGGALVVLGILLCLTGVAIPLGIAMIVAGAGVLAISALAIDWNAIPNKISEIWGNIKQWFSQNVSKIFTTEWWTNLFMCIPNAIASVINGAIETFNSFIQGISDALGSLVGATGGSYTTTSSVPSVRPPGLARGAVIPPNRQFMAILGDQTRGNNIETPEDLMRQVVREETGNMMAEMMMQMQAMGGSVDGGGDTNLTLYIDSEELARATAKGTSSLTRRGVLTPSATFV